VKRRAHSTRAVTPAQRRRLARARPLVADVIARNSPWHRAYDEASCVGRLSEEAWFDAAAFIALEAAIVATPRGTAAGEVALPHLFAIFERISLLLACRRLAGSRAMDLSITGMGEQMLSLARLYGVESLLTK